MAYQPFVDQLNEYFPDCYFRREYRFAREYNKRNWAFDIALKCCKFAIEIEGGATGGFGHRNIGKFLNDIDKYNTASILGWKFIRIRPDEIGNQALLDKIAEYLKHNPCIHSDLNQLLKRNLL